MGSDRFDEIACAACNPNDSGVIEVPLVAHAYEAGVASLAALLRRVDAEATQRAKDEERERCAKVCDEEAERLHDASDAHRGPQRRATYESTLFLGGAGATETCAARIREGR